jgi:hypothetical protein
MGAVAATILTELQQSNDLDALLSQRIIEGVPQLFNGDADLYLSWRADLAGRLGVDPHVLKLVGGACLGASLNPNKGFKTFDPDSDVDVAVISARYFDEAWYYLRMMPVKRFYSLTPRAQTAVKEHRTRYVYWGAIATDRILPYLPFGPTWFTALNQMAQREPTFGRAINIRLYRDIESLRLYQLRSFKDARRRLLEEED